MPDGKYWRLESGELCIVQGKTSRVCAFEFKKHLLPGLGAHVVFAKRNVPQATSFSLVGTPRALTSLVLE